MQLDQTQLDRIHSPHNGAALEPPAPSDRAQTGHRLAAGPSQEPKGQKISTKPDAQTNRQTHSS
jgi:hypothetical protein